MWWSHRRSGMRVALLHVMRVTRALLTLPTNGNSDSASRWDFADPAMRVDELGFKYRPMSWRPAG